jgi:hypothetical protein
MASSIPFEEAVETIPADKLREIIRLHGRDLIGEPARCAALLRDHCSEYRRETSVLIRALNEGIPATIVESEFGSPGLTSESLVRRLHENAGFSGEAAQWAVESWSKALGIRLENQPPSPPTPPPVPPPLPSQQALPYTAPVAPMSMPSALPPSPVLSYNPNLQGVPHNLQAESGDAERSIHWAWIAGLVSACYSLLVFLFTSGASLPPWVFLSVVEGGVATVGLAFGVLQKNRASAILLLTHQVLGLLIAWMEFPTSGWFLLHKLLLLPFLYFYGRAIQATFILHDLELRGQSRVN